jgi:phosphoenolpyruvate-protein phosphotransferase
VLREQFVSVIDIVAPLDGWLVPLAEVPDPVFAGGLAGDGVAIDPVSDLLHAPCDGTVRLMRGGSHALTLVTAAGDLLLHVGIDTVSLRGEGFTLLVADGARVRTGEPLLRFDLDRVARAAPSLVTPVLLTGVATAALTRRRAVGRVRVGDILFAAPRTGEDAVGTGSAPDEGISRVFRVPFDHGLHARPAASVAAALNGLVADVEIRAHGRQANARSMIGLMSLGVAHGDPVETIAHGQDAVAALDALQALFGAPDAAVTVAVVHEATVARPSAGSAIGAVVAARGLAVGHAHRWAVADVDLAPGSGDPGTERSRLDRALAAVASHLRNKASGASGARRDVLDAHLALLDDPGLHGDADRRIAAGICAAAAWRDALSAAAEALARLADERMAERRADLLDLERQVLRVLAGQSPDSAVALAEGAIVLADELLPSQLLSLDAARLAGICTAAGGATSHVAILAGSLGIPMLVAAGPPVLAIADGTPLVLDAEAGVLHIAPAAAELTRHRRRIAMRATEAVEDARRAHEPACLADGAPVRVDCNLGAIGEVAAAVAAGADGCGLLRTEFLFLERDSAPTEAEQHAVYASIAVALGGRPLTIRTLDAGGDKPIPFLPMPAEDNPALGLRGLRTSLWRPELLEAQLRAILSTMAAGPVRLLLPMVTDVADVVAVRECLGRITADGLASVPPLGIMIETPASALLADQLAPLVDFFSIGSNDLSQYVLAIDRLHPVLAARLDGLHPAVLRTIASAAAAAVAHGRELCVCGGLASDPDAVPILVGLGVRELSVLPSMIGRIKNVVRGYDRASCERLAQGALALGSAAEVRALVRNAAGARGAGAVE